jgi:hypothetical protein
LSHPQQAKEMGDRARQLIFEHYTWERIAAKMIEVYTAITNKVPLPLFQEKVPLEVNAVLLHKN